MELTESADGAIFDRSSPSSESFHQVIAARIVAAHGVIRIVGDSKGPLPIRGRLSAHVPKKV